MAKDKPKPKFTVDPEKRPRVPAQVRKDAGMPLGYPDSTDPQKPFMQYTPHEGVEIPKTKGSGFPSRATNRNVRDAKVISKKK